MKPHQSTVSKPERWRHSQPGVQKEEQPVQIDRLPAHMVETSCDRFRARTRQYIEILRGLLKFRQRVQCQNVSRKQNNRFPHCPVCCWNKEMWQ